MRRTVVLIVLLSPVAGAQSPNDHSAHNGHEGMQLDQHGVVMNANPDTLPRGCEQLGAEHAITIHVGRSYAEGRPGMTFGMSEYDVRVEPCSRVQITLVNEDDVRHQWMVHGLPKYLYPAGMFHLEAMGGRRVTGTFIVPGENRTYLVHCDMAQHMEKGLRGQLIVGSGSGDLWSVPGTSDAFYRSSYLPRWIVPLALIAGLLGFSLAIKWGHS